MVRILLIAALALLPRPLGAQNDYGLDPVFNGGNWYVDAFAGSAQLSYRARKMLRLDTGELVVAGVVPKAGRDVLGLVRYDEAGVRQAWSNPGSNGANGNQYLVFDPSSVFPRPVEDVKDIVRFGDRLFVLVETLRYTMTTQPPFQTFFAGHAVDIYVFGTDGAYLGSTAVMSDSSTAAREVFGAGIAVYGNLQFPETVSLVFGGTSLENGQGLPAFARYTVGDDAGLAPVTNLVYPNPGNRCGSPRRCDIAGIALGGRSGSVPRIYLGGSAFAFDNWDFLALRVDANGVPVASFGGDGAATFGFNIAGDTLNDGGRAIVASGGILGNNDEIYVAGDVAVRCGDGVGIAKFRADGSKDTTFGPGGFGAVRFGDSYVAPGTACFNGTPDRYAHALALSGTKLALVGQTNRASIFIGGELNVDAYFGVVDRASGLADFADDFPFRPAGDSRHSGLWDVVDGSNGRFAAAGDVRYRATAPGGVAGKMQFATLRFAPRLDAIFADGLE